MIHPNNTCVFITAFSLSCCRIMSCEMITELVQNTMPIYISGGATYRAAGPWARRLHIAVGPNRPCRYGADCYMVSLIEHLKFPVRGVGIGKLTDVIGYSGHEYSTSASVFRPTSSATRSGCIIAST